MNITFISKTGEKKDIALPEDITHIPVNYLGSKAIINVITGKKVEVFDKRGNETMGTDGKYMPMVEKYNEWNKLMKKELYEKESRD